MVTAARDIAVHGVPKWEWNCDTEVQERPPTGQVPHHSQCCRRFGENLAAFQKAMKPVYDKYADRVGGWKMIQAVIDTK